MLKETIKAIDMGLLMGNAFRNELTKTASLLCKILQQYYIGTQIIEVMCFRSKNNSYVLFLESPALVYNENELNDNSYTLRRIGDHVPTLNQPSLETFLRDFLKPKVPVKITGNV